MEPHFFQFILRAEAMTVADRRLADEQLGRMAQGLWQLRRGAVERWRRLAGRPAPGGTASQALDCQDRTRQPRRVRSDSSYS